MNYKTIDLFIRQFPFRLRKQIYKHFKMNLGKNTFIARGCFFDNPRNVYIGQNCNINYNCEFHTGKTGKEIINIGSNVWCACNVKFITITHELGTNDQRAGKTIFKPISIGNGCWLGEGVTILPGVNIGDGCVVAAGAYVNKDCESNCLIGGVPAKLIKRLP